MLILKELELERLPFWQSRCHFHFYLCCSYSIHHHHHHHSDVCTDSPQFHQSHSKLKLEVSELENETNSASTTEMTSTIENNE